MNYDALFLSVPWTEPIPAVAPVLLSACLKQDNLKAKGIDLSLHFYKEFHKKEYWAELKTKLQIGWVENNKLPRRAVIDILKWIKRYVLNLKKKYNPRWLGLSIFTSESVDFSYMLIYTIRRYWPEVMIAVGGKGTEVEVMYGSKKKHYQQYIDTGLADLAVVNDCEHIISKLIKENAKGVVIASGQTQTELDQSPVPIWDDYDLNAYTDYYDESMGNEPYMAITASKGCVRKCTFCDVEKYWPTYLYRDPTKVAEEIITGYKKTGIKTFAFTDNLINGSVSHYYKLNEILAKEIPGEIKYYGNAIFRGKQHMSEEHFEIAARAGCRGWAIGVESGSEKVRFDMRKKVTDEDTDWTVEMLAKYKIHQKWLMIVGYPTETEKDFQLTLDFLKKWAHLGKQGMVSVSFTPTFMLLDGSPLMGNRKLVHDMGLEHNIGSPWGQKFWTSTVNTSNTFPVRYDRWQRAKNLLEDLGYSWPELIPKDVWTKELDEMMKIYNVKKDKIEKELNESAKRTKTIPIFQN